MNIEVGDRVKVKNLGILENEPPYEKGIVIEVFDKYTNGWNGSYCVVWDPIKKRKICTTQIDDEYLELDND